MIARRLLTLTPDHEPLWVRISLYPVGERWAAAILTDDAPPPEPDSLSGAAFFDETPEEAERLALAYLGEGVSQN